MKHISLLLATILLLAGCYMPSNIGDSERTGNELPPGKGGSPSPKPYDKPPAQYNQKPFSYEIGGGMQIQATRLESS